MKGTVEPGHLVAIQSSCILQEVQPLLRDPLARVDTRRVVRLREDSDVSIDAEEENGARIRTIPGQTRLTQPGVEVHATREGTILREQLAVEDAGTPPS